MVCLLPPMQLSGHVAADLDPHPTAAVVINSVSRFIRVTCRVGVAHHRMPCFGKVTPVFSLLQADKDRPSGGTPRYSACLGLSVVSFTPIFSRCSRATSSSSFLGSV